MEPIIVEPDQVTAKNEPKSKSEIWREILDRQQASGKSMSGFCREEGIAPWQFWYWRRRLKGTMEPAAASAPEPDAGKESPAGMFQEWRWESAAGALSAAGPGVELRLPNGLVLRVREGTAEAWVGRLVTVLRSC